MHQPIQTHRKWWCEPYGCVPLRYMSFPEYMCAVALTLAKASGPNSRVCYISRSYWVITRWTQECTMVVWVSRVTTQKQRLITLSGPQAESSAFIFDFPFASSAQRPLNYFSLLQTFKYDCGMCWQLLQFMVEWLNKKVSYATSPDFFYKDNGNESI